MADGSHSGKRITIHHQVSDLRLIRASLRFSLRVADCPHNFEQQVEAEELIQRITDELARIADNGQLDRQVV